MAKATGSAKRAPAKKVPAAKRASTTGPAGKAPAAKRKSAAKRPSAKKTGPDKKVPAAKRASAKKTGPAKKTASGGRARSSMRSPGPFGAAWLAAQEQALRDERATYVRQADTLQAEAEALVADFESGDTQFDEESGEGDTLSIERERDLALSAQARAAVEEIDHALAKFAHGTYGICESSGEPIPAERLEAIPWARVRVEHKTGGLGRR